MDPRILQTIEQTFAKVAAEQVLLLRADHWLCTYVKDNFAFEAQQV